MSSFTPRVNGPSRQSICARATGTTPCGALCLCPHSQSEWTPSCVHVRPCHGWHNTLRRLLSINSRLAISHPCHLCPRASLLTFWMSLCFHAARRSSASLPAAHTLIHLASLLSMTMPSTSHAGVATLHLHPCSSFATTKQVLL